MGVIRSVLLLPFTPSFTAPLSLALAFGPSSIRDPLLGLLSNALTEANIERLIVALKWLTILGIARKLNARLNRWALNNWRWTTNTKAWDWEREVVVITGGCSGIGLSTVKQLLQKRLKVAIFDIQAPPKEIENHPNMQYFYCDVTDRSSIATAASQLRVKWGDPSILINNAGIGKPHSIIETPDDFVTKIFTINVISHFWMVKEFMPAMLSKNKGHIVGIASMASWVAPPGMVDYASTKSAVQAFHEGLNMEIKHIYKKLGVLNTVVHPSWVRTPLIGGYESHLEKTQGKLLKPEQIAKKIVDQIVSCNGGQLFMPGRMSTATRIRGEANWLQELIRDFAVGSATSSPPAL
ncbi:uncharacterized protein PV09_01331 [Verruconis gallopava]|uniref:Short-chain dehydrogenase/reductase 3 n=1 Tax=Verruconis gallopava TaxID=253628 RepID=A0A0D2AP18_9PEZI|nr:uncharacterized protein PV09_01331 [Verruconis gallopava]KIW08428.1 hypothetical protein PV09_01331 [Verruconis gallopava]